MTIEVPLILLEGISREYISGEQTVSALKNVSLTVQAGEMIAIVGASGSGKSTLMNILGCLDKPTAGQYRFAGQAVSTMSPEELAKLRREHFGFIFQRYHLLADLTAEGNVEVPAIYAGVPNAQRKRRARELLDDFGLADRSEHRPGQLSGGQQQRVSIARALMNGGQVILADEPTGALDSRSGEQFLEVLRDLHRKGHTIILVTHDMKVASHANRIVEIADGEVINDRRISSESGSADLNAAKAAKVSLRLASDAAMEAGRQIPASNTVMGGKDRLMDAMHMAVVAMSTHRLRTFLTMLGIVIGVASVVTVLAVGEGSRRKVLESISDLGTNTIEVWAGRGWGDPDAQKRIGLRAEDAQALAREPYLEGASPVVEVSLTARRGNIVATANVTGVSDQYFSIMGLRLAVGTAFDADAVERRAQDVVIDPTARKTLFPDGENPLGKVVMLGGVPVRIVGVLAPNAALSRWPGGQSLKVFAPYTTVTDRITGNSRLDSITVRVRNFASPAAAESAVTQVLTLRRGNSDFSIMNADSIRKTLEATSATLTLLLSTIALISLFVGGIGVMNIMLVSVSERTREIGVRMAIGARRSDILRQFLIEAVLVCLTGGTLGVVFALGGGKLLELFSTSYETVYSGTAIAVAFASSVLIGVVFGYLPASNAAKLDPVAALARE